jgi:alanine-alpha-ketoisovalerate/valine-pyruvate aminotransferase
MIRSKQQREIVIDLTGPQGNAFALMGMAQNFGRQLGWDKAKTQDLINEMMDGDYENLIQVFDREFGSFVILER